MKTPDTSRFNPQENEIDAALGNLEKPAEVRGKEAVDALANSVVSGVKSAANTGKNLMSRFGGFLKGGWEKLAGKGPETAYKAVGTAIIGAEKLYGGAVTTGKSAYEGGVNMYKSGKTFLENDIQQTKEHAIAGKDFVVGTVKSGVEFTANTVQKGAEYVQNDWEATKQRQNARVEYVKDTAVNTYDGVVNGVGSAMEWTKVTGKNVAEGVQSGYKRTKEGVKNGWNSMVGKGAEAKKALETKVSGAINGAKEIWKAYQETRNANAIRKEHERIASELFRNMKEQEVLEKSYRESLSRMSELSEVSEKVGALSFPETA